jgi:HK97 family phage major capsid protein/HK97 family phage prohead protease
MNRAYAVLDVKSVDEDKRVISGIATTPTPDRVGDIVEPLGVKFKNPLPLLWQHMSDKPVGSVKFNKPTKDGITFEASLPTLSEPGTLKDRIDEAWQSVKMQLVRGVSIGFRAIEYSWMDDGGIRFLESEVLELSLVTIPANADATIQSIKSFDAPLLAATGKEPKDSDRPTPPAPGKVKSTPVFLKGPGRASTMKTIAEQIAAFEAQRTAKATEMSALQQKALDEGRSKDAQEKETFDNLAAEIMSIDEELIDLRKMEKINVTKATPVKVDTQEDGAAARGGDHRDIRVVVSPKKLPPGIGFTRYVMAAAMAKGNPMQALEIFKSRPQWMAETPDVLECLKTAVTAGSTSDTTWASPLVNYQILTGEFIEYLRPLTIIGRIPGLTRVPFKVKIPRQIGGATVNWVGEGAPKPLTSLAFDSVTLDFAKIAGIIVINQELARLASPSAELLVRNDLAAAVVQFMDSQFVDPTKSATSGVSPASITNGVTPTIATGTTGAALRADMKTMLSAFLTANMQVSNVVLLMSQRVALSISLMTNSLGQKEFPGLTMNGGDLMGIPVITSENIPSTGGSPTDGDPIIVLSAPDILLADDGQVSIDASQEASLQMDTAPDSPATASTTFVSLWQQNQIGIRAERYINWAKRRTTAVAYISNAKYFE